MTPIIGQPSFHKKAWGYELWIHNSEKYCGKILHFNKGSKFSLHFHLKKEETWYIATGKFKLVFVETEKASIYEMELQPGMTIHLVPGVPHQLVAIEEGEVFEVSTQHFDNDSYRIGMGDSQAPAPAVPPTPPVTP